MTTDSKRTVWRELLARELWPCARKGARSLLATFARSQRFPSAGVATLITIAVALPVFKCADKKTYIYDSSPNTFVLLVEAIFSERSSFFDSWSRSRSSSLGSIFLPLLLRTDFTRREFFRWPLPLSVARLVWSNGACSIFRTAILLYTRALPLYTMDIRSLRRKYQKYRKLSQSKEKEDSDRQ